MYKVFLSIFFFGKIKNNTKNSPNTGYGGAIGGVQMKK